MKAHYFLLFCGNELRSRLQIESLIYLRTGGEGWTTGILGLKQTITNHLPMLSGKWSMAMRRKIVEVILTPNGE